MSKMAQELQKSVNEMRAAAPRTLKRSSKSAKTTAATLAGLAARKRDSRSAQRAKRATTSRHREARHLKMYRLVDGIPATIRNPSAGRSILEVIEAQGTPTGAAIRAALPKMPAPTIGFYLGKFQRTQIVAAQ